MCFRSVWWVALSFGGCLYVKAVAIGTCSRSQCVRWLYNSLIRKRDSSCPHWAQTHLRIPPLPALTVLTHTHTLHYSCYWKREKARGCCKALTTLSFLCSTAIVNVPERVLNSIIIIITVMISHYRNNGCDLSCILLVCILLCHCVARDRGVNYVGRVYVCVLDARWIFISRGRGNPLADWSDNHRNMRQIPDGDPPRLMSTAVVTHTHTHSHALKENLLIRTVFKKNCWGQRDVSGWWLCGSVFGSLVFAQSRRQGEKPCKTFILKLHLYCQR